MFRVCTALMVGLLHCGLIDAEPPKVVLALEGNDPVELIAGKTVPGMESISITHGRYRYQFSTEANRTTFQKNPSEYSIQFDGACMRMGPFSGHGNPDRYVVFQKRIYLFASESCREAFKAAPELYIDKPDQPPTGTAAEIKRGQELVELALQGLGGAKAVDGVRSWEMNKTLSYPQKGKDPFLMQERLTVLYPDQFREELSYAGWSGIVGTNGKITYQTSKSTAWQLEAGVSEAFTRKMYRLPLNILKARNQPGFIAVAHGPGKVDEQNVEWLAVGFCGATTELALELKKGQILEVKYHDRAGAMIGEVSIRFNDFREVGALTLPHGIIMSHNGKAVKNPEAKVTSISMNPKLDPKIFAKPD